MLRENSHLARKIERQKPIRTHASDQMTVDNICFSISANSD